MDSGVASKQPTKCDSCRERGRAGYRSKNAPKAGGVDKRGGAAIESTGTAAGAAGVPQADGATRGAENPSSAAGPAPVPGLDKGVDAAPSAPPSTNASAGATSAEVEEASAVAAEVQAPPPKEAEPAVRAEAPIS